MLMLVDLLANHKYYDNDDRIFKIQHNFKGSVLKLLTHCSWTKCHSISESSSDSSGSTSMSVGVTSLLSQSSASQWQAPVHVNRLSLHEQRAPAHFLHLQLTHSGTACGADTFKYCLWS